MEIKKRIKPNEELYGDFELIPLNLDAVQQRIDFFKDKCEDMWNNGLAAGYEWNEVYKHMKFWEGIKKEHCEVEV